jgi:carboxymethylenebutenolidase
MSEARNASQGASGSACPFYMAGHANAGGPGLIIFTPIFGIDAEMMGVAHRWAAKGFRVAVPDYFWRVQPGPLDRSDAGRAQGMERLKNLDVTQAIEDVRPLVEMLRKHSLGNGKVGALGFCAGGELAYLAATRLGADAVAGFHATKVHAHLDELANAKGAISMHYGDADPLVPMDQVEQVRKAFAGKPGADVHVYAGAQHGFSFQGRPSYHEEAATKSQAEAMRLMQALR